SRGDKERAIASVAGVNRRAPFIQETLRAYTRWQQHGAEGGTSLTVFLSRHDGPDPNNQEDVARAVEAGEWGARQILEAVERVDPSGTRPILLFIENAEFSIVLRQYLHEGLYGPLVTRATEDALQGKPIFTRQHEAALYKGFAEVRSNRTQMPNPRPV